MGISPPPGTPPAAPLGYGSIIVTVICHGSPRRVTSKSYQEQYPRVLGGITWQLWLAGSSPRNNGKVSVEGIFSYQRSSVSVYHLSATPSCKSYCTESRPYKLTFGRYIGDPTRTKNAGRVPFKIIIWPNENRQLFFYWFIGRLFRLWHHPYINSILSTFLPILVSHTTARNEQRKEFTKVIADLFILCNLL